MLDAKSAEEWSYCPLEPQTAVVAQGTNRATKVPMWLFVAGRRRILSTLPVDVEISRQGPDAESSECAFVFACKKLHVFASAPTYKDAEDLFHEQVVHFYESYRDANPDELAEDAAEIRELYTRNFQESPDGG